MEPTPNRRHQRLNDLIRDHISELLHRHARDPRLSTMVSITDVEISADLRYAKIFASIMGDEEEQKAALRTLRGAEGFLRKELGPRIKMRYIPELHFQQDISIERGARLTQLLKEVVPSEPESPPEES